MIIDVEGIVLDERAYGETSKIINVLTKDYGIIGMIAKGARSLKSELRSTTTKLTYGLFHIYYKEDKLSTLTSVDVLNRFKNIQKDITKISYATFALDLARQVVKQYYTQAIYEMLIAALLKIDEGFDPLVITNILELKYLEYLGVMPIVEACSVCGNKEGIVTLSVERGGYVCQNCHTEMHKNKEWQDYWHIKETQSIVALLACQSQVLYYLCRIYQSPNIQNRFQAVWLLYLLASSSLLCV